MPHLLGKIPMNGIFASVAKGNQPPDSLTVPDSARMCTSLCGRDAVLIRIAYFAAVGRDRLRKKRNKLLIISLGFCLGPDAGHYIRVISYENGLVVKSGISHDIIIF